MKNSEELKPLQNIFSEQKAKHISCTESHESHFLCANDQCNHFPFICTNEECKCSSNHQQCVKLIKKSLIDAIQKKRRSYKTIENKVKEEIQKAIDQLSQIETLLIAQCQQKFKDLTGLSELQKNFLKAIEQGKLDDIKGSTIWNIQLNLKKPQEVDSLMGKLESEINKIWHRFEQNLTELHANINTKIEAFGKESDNFKESKVVVNEKQERIIDDLFQSQGQKIKSVKMLYRGSQQNFSATNFHNLCNGQTQTITICQNIYGKKIGGYTPLAWIQNSSSSYLKDSLNKSFVFSLTNNHKLVADAGSAYHIFCRSDFGPTFGGGHDLYLSDKCHQNESSYANINHTYKNLNYMYDSKKSFELFSGSNPNQNPYFRIKEYEVWKVQFA